MLRRQAVVQTTILNWMTSIPLLTVPCRLFATRPWLSYQVTSTRKQVRTSLKKCVSDRMVVAGEMSVGSLSWITVKRTSCCWRIQHFNTLLATKPHGRVGVVILSMATLFLSTTKSTILFVDRAKRGCLLTTGVMVDVRLPATIDLL